MQDGYDNEPDYFDAINTLTAGQGGIVEVTKAFSEARYFVGDYDDGAHLEGASTWFGSEPMLTATWSTGSLPVRDQGAASTEELPQPNGCNYVKLDVTSRAHSSLRFSFAGKPAYPGTCACSGWAARPAPSR